jgi:hypothetical protein
MAATTQAAALGTKAAQKKAQKVVGIAAAHKI